MTTPRRIVIARSTALFVLLGAVETQVHELGHALAALAVGAQPVVLYPTAVDSHPHSAAAFGAFAIAGPLTSLLVAAAGAIAYRSLPDASPETRLAALWAAFHGFVGAVGYLILTPFGGDLGGIAHAFHVPSGLRWALFALGIWSMTRISAVLAPRLADIAPSSTQLATPGARAEYIRDVAVIPWIVNLVAAAAAQYPAARYWSLAPLFGSGLPLVSMMFDVRKREDLASRAPAWRESFPWIIVAAAIALSAFIRFVVHPGIRL